jgi:transposase
VGALGRLLTLAVPPGHRPDLDAAGAVLAAPPGGPGRVVADRGSSAGRFRGAAAALGAGPCAPAHPTHPPAPYDRGAYARREVVERFRGRIKEWRGVAARHDKAAASYRAGVLLAATLDWLKD